MAQIIDVSSTCGSKAASLFAAGVRTVIRYYSRDTIRPSKRLSAEEAHQFTAAGLRIGIVHEGRRGDKADNFDRATGVADGLYSRTYGSATIGQPAGSTIYFGVDFDASSAEIRDRIVPYFQGVADAFAHATGDPAYDVGVYGSGAVCKTLLDAGLARRAWLAQSTGWTGFQAFLASGRWSLRQEMPATVAGVDCDPDVAGASHDIGDFSLTAAPIAAGRLMRVNARRGLLLRPGPGTEFDPVGGLPLGTTVHPLRNVGSWTLVDLQGDGSADGFVSTAFLVDVAGGSVGVATGTVAPVTGDALHVPELVRQASSAAGLKAARVVAARALPGYPHNGCAAHLSALLRQSGIDVAMTLGAGRMAHDLAKRGWGEVRVGAQQPGDVGVTFDNDPKIPGADHIYLVVATRGPDEMLIADNQRQQDAPHTRFASGKGKTPTDFFLRA
jgi:hypothetical protein